MKCRYTTIHALHIFSVTFGSRFDEALWSCRRTEISGSARPHQSLFPCRYLSRLAEDRVSLLGREGDCSGLHLTIHQPPDISCAFLSVIAGIAGKCCPEIETAGSFLHKTNMKKLCITYSEIDEFEE